MELTTAEDVYASPRVVTDLADCHFYHTTEIPGIGVVTGAWDLRPGISQYLGGADFRGKRVLEVGTASGFVCFHIESLGGDVVAVDLSERESWDLVPYASVDAAAVLAQRRGHARRINNAFWLCHRAFQSHAKMVYSTAYEIPDAVGPVDMTVFAAILLHMRDPWLALERTSLRTRETMVVTDLAPSDDRELAFVPDASKEDTTQTWWRFSPEVIVRYLGVLGFGNAVVTRHNQLVSNGAIMPMFTVVARRLVGRPAQ
jgi:hypothetical protein